MTAWRLNHCRNSPSAWPGTNGFRLAVMVLSIHSPFVATLIPRKISPVTRPKGTAQTTARFGPRKKRKMKAAATVA